MKNDHGLGISWLWQLSSEHPFHGASLRHDKYYDERASGNISKTSSKQYDKIFLQDCLEIAGKNWKLISQAYLFYSLARIWGIFNWK